MSDGYRLQATGYWLLATVSQQLTLLAVARSQ
jgi:hypothetical protein